MSGRTDAPIGFECPYRHRCPHLDTLSASWALEVYRRYHQLLIQQAADEARYRQRIGELEKTLLERDEKIAQLRVAHQKQFKRNAKPKEPPPPAKARRRGAPVGHPGWHRDEPDHIDQEVQVAAPVACPHCGCTDLEACPEVYEHVQEDIVLVPRPFTTKFVHAQCVCPRCRRPVYQAGPGELRNCGIGPVTRAVAMHLRYDLQIPYRKVQHILQDLFGMPLVHATAMNFDRQATALGRPLYHDLRIKLQSSKVAYGDETSWREDGQGGYVWYGGNPDLAVYQITDNRAAQSAVQLLGKGFEGTLVSDDYAGYNAVEAKHQQTCWNHLRTKAKEVLEQIQMMDPPVAAPRSVEFCQKLRRFAAEMCLLGRQQRAGKLSLAKSKAMIPALRQRLRRLGSQALEHPEAQTLRQRVMEKDRDKLFTFLAVKGVEPTNNHAERSLRFLVIMRKVCLGTRSPEGSQSHSVLPSLLQTAQRQGKDALGFLITLLTQPLDAAQAALFSGGS
jgi:transposase